MGFSKTHVQVAIILHQGCSQWSLIGTYFAQLYADAEGDDAFGLLITDLSILSQGLSAGKEFPRSTFSMLVIRRADNASSRGTKLSEKRRKSSSPSPLAHR